MTSAVIDTSAFVKYVLPEDHSDTVRRIIGQHRSSSLELTAPEYILTESANVLWKSVVRDNLPPDHAVRALRLLRQTGLVLVPESQLLDDALLFASHTGITVYDALFCVLAQRRQVPLITADRPLVARLRSSPIQALTLDQIPW